MLTAAASGAGGGGPGPPRRAEASLMTGNPGFPDGLQLALLADISSPAGPVFPAVKLVSEL